MVKMAVIYHSVAGATAQLAQAAVSGARAVGASAALHAVQAHRIVEGRLVDGELLMAVDEADAVIFASPTYMGGPSAQFKTFADASSDRWQEQRWRGKLAAGLTSGACPNGDQTSTLQYFSVLAAQHGMLWVGVDIPGGHDSTQRNPLGVQLGVAAQVASGVVRQADLDTAHYLAQRLAQLAQRLGPIGRSV